MEKIHGEQVWGDPVSSASTHLTADARPCPKQPFLPPAPIATRSTNPEDGCHVAPSKRKILPSTFPSKPELPQVANAEAISNRSLSLPQLFVKPALEGSFAAPSARLPDAHPSVGYRSRAIRYLLEDPTGKFHPPGLPRYRTAQDRRQSAHWSGPVRARQGITGVRASPTTGRRQERA